MTGKAFAHRSGNVLGDLHQTHYSLTWELLKRESFTGSILDPGCGQGAITSVLIEKLPACDIRGIDKFYGPEENRQDFLDYSRTHDAIIGNPPYNQADDFVLHSRRIAPKVALLLRTNYLSGQKRAKLGVYDELKHIYVLNRMPDLNAPLREDGKFPTAMIVYAWFIWERGWRMEPTFRQMDVSEYVLKKGRDKK